ncbi:MAG TPA: protein-disulfide reductase DsbD domain-containing protein, partial [Sphingomonadaceae bacterium]|nr:protein-disulfide reductase DsbD domain-containing protein [Sphingomonadaceae bacterium]
MAEALGRASYPKQARSIAGRQKHVPVSRVFLQFLILVLVALSSSSALAQSRANHIAAELVPEGPATPGEVLEVALLMTPEESWHGYWSNPGDAGYAISFEWGIPDGWEVGEPQYPVPETLLIADLMNHVYEGQYAVLLPFSIPADAREGSVVPVTLEAQWLACTDEVCVPERASLGTSIAIGGDGAAEPRFDAWRSAIPALIDRKGSFQPDGNRLLVSIPLPASLQIEAPHLFLDNEELVDYAAPQEYWRDGDQLIIQLALKSDSVATPAKVSGILKLDDAGGGIRFEADPGEVGTGGTRLVFGGTGELSSL